VRLDPATIKEIALFNQRKDGPGTGARKASPDRLLNSQPNEVFSLTDAPNPLPPGGVLVPMEPKLWSEQPHYALREDKTTIGRGSGCDIRIANPTISRLHLELAWRGETLILTHLSPVNPTFVNGAPVAEPRALHNGDIIEVANGVALRVELFDSGDKEVTQFRGRDVRRMYAILSADVFGYTRLVEQDDIATARQLESCLKIVRDRVEQMDGRIFQIVGDGIVALFNSAASAVKSAVVVQSELARRNAALPPARRMEFRIGINSGDLLVTPVGAIVGDAINIAARVQTIAPPGGVFITGVVRDQLQGQIDLKFEFVQSTEMKNLAREVRVYRVEF
jgi:class 3 adenylate cyclase